MNDEQGFDPPQMSPEERRRSRWAVQPGSISDSLSFRRPEDMDEEAPRERRPASEIIREVRETPATDEASTQIGSRKRAPSRGSEEVHRPADTATRARDAAANEAATTRAATPSASATRSSRTQLVDESTRVKPDMGENRDLRAATGGTTSSLVMAGFGGVILVAIGGLIGAILDYLFTDRVGVVTIIGLALGAVIAALITRKRDLVSVMVAPPIVYAVIAAIVLMISARPVQLTSIADVAIRGFPAMALAAGLAAVIAGIRLATSRAGERR